MKKIEALLAFSGSWGRTLWFWLWWM